MWNQAVQFIQILKSIINGFLAVCPDLYRLLELTFMVTLVLAIMKSARYRENGG